MSFHFSSPADTPVPLIETPPMPKLCVFGVGGAGGNVVNRMIDANVTDVDYVVLNTDMMDLNKSKARSRIIIGKKITRGLGAGMRPDVGKKSVFEVKEEIQQYFEDMDMLFIAAGMGGGTGTGAAPSIAEWAMEKHVLTIAVVTTPFQFEGKKRMKIAEEGIEELKKHVDVIMVIPNEKLFLLDKNKKKPLKLSESFTLADNILKNAISGLTDMINKTGTINLDFADVKTVMEKKGKAIIGTGYSSGENRGREAAKMAISSPLLQYDQIHNSTGLIINITADPDLTLEQAQEACLVIEETSENADVIWGISYDTDLKEEVHVTIIATGFENYHEGAAGSKTLGVRDGFKVYDDQKGTKISEVHPVQNFHEPSPYMVPQVSPAPTGKTGASNLRHNAVTLDPTSTESVRNNTHPENVYRLEKNDMREIEDKAHTPEHLKTSDAKNIDVPAYIRRQTQEN